MILSFFHCGIVSSARAADEAQGIASVAVMKVSRESLAKEVRCDAEFRPYQEIDLHAKVSGFVESIDVDIGDQVDAKQRIATLEIPELRDDLEHALAVEDRSNEEVRRAEAAYEDAHSVAERLSNIGKTQPNLIAQQDVDSAKARDRGAGAALAAAKLAVKEAHALVNKLNTLLKYSVITAPFRGVITKRYADQGAMIQAGTASSTQAMPLVRLSEMDKLRLMFPVSMSYVDRVKVGDTIEVRSTSTPLSFTATISRLSRKVDTATRTMEVEADIPNPDLRIIPGSYASVTLHVASRENAVAVPLEAVSGTDGNRVYVVNGKNEIEERILKLGLETPTKAEVIEGLRENDLVVIGANDQVRPGLHVEPRLIKK